MKHSFMSLLTAVVLVLGFAMEAARANGVTVTDVTVSGANFVNHSVYINFHCSWNSPGGDPVWVFAKFQDRLGAWHSPTLSGSYWGLTADGKGMFDYYSGVGIYFLWNYGADGFSDFDSVVVKVFAIEMVINTAGVFPVGDPNAPGSGPTGGFYSAVTNGPYFITTEAAITVGTASGNLFYNSGGDQTGPIPDAFPKGFYGFYSMKYEISEGQYADFLNTLTPTQAANRWSASSSGSRYGISYSSGIYVASRPDRACNFLSWADGCAYADWAGLRPMTEFEYEKAARGIFPALASEYAWGTTSITAATTISGVEDGTDTIVNANANCNYNSTTLSGGDPAAQGPLRVGIFATSSTGRTKAGASFNGSMEMSGNLKERVVTVGSASGRAYTGNNGDGSLDVSGNANVTGWPTTTGFGSRGGGFNSPSSECQVADRSQANNSVTTRNADFGFRCVRSN